jgi:chemotaxis signal transduction protein
MPTEILIFLLDQQRFALPSVLVLELLRMVEMIAVPVAPKWVEGAIDYRGKILPVLDLRQYLGLTSRAPQPTDYLIILCLNERLVAIRVDRAHDVSRIERAVNEGAADGSDISTVVHVQDGTAIVLNLMPLLAGIADTIQPTDTDRSA